MKTMARSALWAIAVASLALVAASASAQEEEASVEAEDPAVAEARALFTRGVEMAQQERWGEAERAFRRAHALHRAPSIAMGWAGSLQRLSRHAAAQRVFAEWLEITEGSAEPAERAEVEQLMVLGRQRFAVVHLSVPSDAAVRVDAAPAELIDGELWLDPGRHTLEVRAAGHLDSEREITVAAGEDTSLEITLEPEPEPEAPAPQHTPERLPEPEPEPPAPSADPTGWIVLGIGAGASVVGAIVLGLGVADYDAVTGAMNGTAWDDLEPAYQRAPGEIVGGAVVLGVGAAAMALGLALALTSRGDEGVALRVGPGSLTVAGRFP